MPRPSTPSRHMPAMILSATAEVGDRMSYYELHFRLRHDCPYVEFSEAHPSVVISHWCNWSRDVLEIFAPKPIDPDLGRAIRRMLARLGSKAIRSVEGSQGTRVVLQHCACDRLPPPTLPAIEKRNCLNLQPMVYHGGWEGYRIIAFSDLDVRKLFRDLEKRATLELLSRRTVAAESVHNSLTISTGTLLSGLTGRQARALVAALDHGYYRLPRAATSVEIARRLGVPRSSFVDHLRKAQNKIIQSIGPYLRMRTALDYSE